MVHLRVFAVVVVCCSPQISLSSCVYDAWAHHPAQQDDTPPAPLGVPGEALPLSTAPDASPGNKKKVVKKVVRKAPAPVVPSPGLAAEASQTPVQPAASKATKVVGGVQEAGVHAQPASAPQPAASVAPGKGEEAASHMASPTHVRQAGASTPAVPEPSRSPPSPPRNNPSPATKPVTSSGGAHGEVAAPDPAALQPPDTSGLDRDGVVALLQQVHFSLASREEQLYRQAHQMSTLQQVRHAGLLGPSFPGQYSSLEILTVP